MVHSHLQSCPGSFPAIVPCYSAWLDLPIYDLHYQIIKLRYISMKIIGHCSAATATLANTCEQCGQSNSSTTCRFSLNVAVISAVCLNVLLETICRAGFVLAHIYL